MKLILPLITFLLSNLWGFYGGIPFTIIEPSGPFLDRSIGSLQVASTINTLAEIGEFFANKTVPDLPTIPRAQANANATVNPDSLPKIGRYTIHNPIDLLFNHLRSTKDPQPTSPPPRLSAEEIKDISLYGIETLAFSTLVVFLLFIKYSVWSMRTEHQNFQNELRNIIAIQTREISNIRTGLGYMYDPIINTQDEIQQLRRSLRGIEHLPQDLVRLSRELEESLQARFAEMSQTRILDTQVPEEAKASVEKEKFWKDTWTEIKDDLKRTAEGFQAGMNVFLEVHMGVLSNIVDVFQQRSSAAVAAEVARAFVAQLKNQEVDVKIERTQDDAQDEGLGEGEQDEGDLMNFDHAE